MNHHGEVFADKCYTIETLSEVLGYPDTRKVREFVKKGLKRRKEGMRSFITGAAFIRWVERGDECQDDDDLDVDSAE